MQCHRVIVEEEVWQLFFAEVRWWAYLQDPMCLLLKWRFRESENLSEAPHIWDQLVIQLMGKKWKMSVETRLTDICNNIRDEKIRNDARTSGKRIPSQAALNE